MNEVFLKFMKQETEFEHVIDDQGYIEYHVSTSRLFIGSGMNLSCISCTSNRCHLPGKHSSGPGTDGYPDGQVSK